MKSNFAIGMERGSKAYKIFMALPVLDLTWGFYRLSQSVRNAKFFETLLATLLFFFGISFMWLVDIISIAKTGHILWFKDGFEDAIPSFVPEDNMMKEVYAFQEKQKERIEKEDAKRLRKEERRKQKEEEQKNHHE